MSEERTYLTPEDVGARIERIKTYVGDGDNEEAHTEEDAMFIDVLRAIANKNCEDPSLCAAVALQSQDIEFDRWYE